MRRELDERLIDRWPMWFNVEDDLRPTAMPFGFAHGDGWFDLVWRLCERLEPVVAAAEMEAGRPFRVLQVKQKFGGLRFYTSFGNDAVSALVEAAEGESFKTCEGCGKPGAHRGAVMIATMCNEHADPS